MVRGSADDQVVPGTTTPAGGPGIPRSGGPTAPNWGPEHGQRTRTPLVRARQCRSGAVTGRRGCSSGRSGRHQRPISEVVRRPRRARGTREGCFGTTTLNQGARHPPFGGPSGPIGEAAHPNA